jgi:hypothetical protein
MISPMDFLNTIRALQPEQESVTKMGAIPGTYVSGRPAVIFEGEATATTKTYPYLSSYTPTIGDKVLLIRAGSTWVILGKIT